MSTTTPMGDDDYVAACCPLDLVESFLIRFIAYPSVHALTAHVLWIAHTHLIQSFDTTPRLAFMSAEKESGKTRALEITALLVPDPILSISASPAVIVRLVSKGRATILYDEIDGVFGNAKVQEANIDLRSVLNGGYRRGAKVHRCTVNTKKVETEALDAFAPVAVAGLRTLPDTLASRAIIIRMKRRSPDERIEPFRHRYHPSEAKPIREALEEWCQEHEAAISGVEPDLPEGIEDRAADIWEPLIAIADAAGGEWPKQARKAALYLTDRARDEAQTKGVELLEHVKDAFGNEDRIWTETLCDKLNGRDESPWKEMRNGHGINDRLLAARLKPYAITSRSVRIGEVHRKGYLADDFTDSWGRYCPFVLGERDKRDKRDIIDNENNYVPDVPDVPDTAPIEQKGREEREPSGSAPSAAVGESPDYYPELPECLDRRAACNRQAHDITEGIAAGCTVAPVPRENERFLPSDDGDPFVPLKKTVLARGLRVVADEQRCPACDGEGCEWCQPEPGSEG